jgi:hypothetical protein
MGRKGEAAAGEREKGGLGLRVWGRGGLYRNFFLG